MIGTITPQPWTGSTIRVAQPWLPSAPSTTQDTWTASETTSTLDALVVSRGTEPPAAPSVGEIFRRAVTSAVAVSTVVGAFAFLAPVVTEAGSLPPPVSQSVELHREDELRERRASDAQLGSTQPTFTQMSGSTFTGTATGMGFALGTTSAGHGLRLGEGRTETGVLGLGSVRPEGFLQIADSRVPEAAPAQKTYPQMQIHKGDYVAHGINFSSLISNEELTDAQAMNVEDVQKYLQERESFLADYQENGVSAATMVTSAASTYQINPRIILATLEKEAGLVSRKSDPPRWLLKSAMGYAYNDGGSTAGRRSGFAYQVDNGTRLLRELYDEGLDMSMPAKKSVDYGKRTIRVNNAATWALMRYTPHTRDHNLRQIGGGNYLFRNVLTNINRDVGAQRI